MLLRNGGHMFVVRAIFWVGLVALLMPLGAHRGPGADGNLARTFQENVLSAIARVRAEIEAQQPIRTKHGFLAELNLQAETPLPSGLAQPRAPWSPSPLSPPRRL